MDLTWICILIYTVWYNLHGLLQTYTNCHVKNAFFEAKQNNMSDQLPKPLLVLSWPIDPHLLTCVHCHRVEFGLDAGTVWHCGDNSRDVTFESWVLIDHFREDIVTVLKLTPLSHLGVSSQISKPTVFSNIITSLIIKQSFPNIMFMYRNVMIITMI